MIVRVSKAAAQGRVLHERTAPVAEHCSEAEYWAFLESLPVKPHHRQTRMLWRRRFVDRWPRLSEWLSEPIMQRLGRCPGEPYKAASFSISFNAHSYLCYLALTDRLRLDYPFLLGLGALHAFEVAPSVGIDWQTETLERIGVELGYQRYLMMISLRWAMPRIALHTGIDDVTLWSDEHLTEFEQAIRAFRLRPITSKRRGRPSIPTWLSHLNKLRVLLHHRGNLVTLPRRVKPLATSLRCGAASLREPAERWLGIKAPGWSFRTTEHQRISLNHFLRHLESTAPEVKKFSELTPAHATSFVADLMHTARQSTGRPLFISSRRERLSAVAAFLSDAAAWGWPDMPKRPILDLSSLPRIPRTVPRFIPAAELNKLMDAVRALRCPWQRAAILTARWSGARRDEITRLALDCLDSYADGTARLRIPAGKTYRERLVPLHSEAADTLRTLIAQRRAAPDRPIIDRRTDQPVRYVFLRRGRPISAGYLFELGLRTACQAAGLVDSQGRYTVTAHRFRHTVGTQLAERGAKLHTIMSVLGHESPHMSMIYARISDAEVLRDYQSVLSPGAPLAGAGAEIVRAGKLSSSDIDWLQTNFFKTALELGHCLRLPSEGPCECDLYLSCAKFVTTPKYAQRLRERHQLEVKLAEDARERGWSREVERHFAIARRVVCLLKDLGEPLTS